MSREAVQNYKRALRSGSRPGASPDGLLLARDAALNLLARSVDFGHGRLAVLRLSIAVHAGAEIPGDHWNYCSRVAEASKDPRLQELYLAARASTVTAG